MPRSPNKCVCPRESGLSIFHVQVKKISISLFEFWKQESGAEACKAVKVGQ